MRDDGAFMVGSKRVVFMHFSGISDFASYNIEAVSKHQNRFTMSDFPDLRERTVRSKLVDFYWADYRLFRINDVSV